MKQKWKTIGWIVAFVALIGISTLIYKVLSKNYSLDKNIELPQTTEETVDEAAPEGAEEPEPMKALDFTMEDKDGKEVKLSDFEGKPVVVNFWASWCPPCKEEMPDFEKVWNEMGDEVTFLMVNMTDGQRETVEKGKKYIEKNDFSFPVYYDVNQEAAYGYAVTSLPTSLFIDKDGYVITGAKGMIDEATLRKGISMIQ